MAKHKTALVLEGGGMRGAYTAGALSYLIDNDIRFDNAYGISTGAVYLLNYLIKSKKNLYDFSIKGIADKRVIGIRSLLSCGRIVNYDVLFDQILPNEYNFNLEDLKNIDTDAYIGLYDLKIGKTEYYSVKNITMDVLKASTSLPILGKIVKYEDKELLDGGITDMIPIQKALDDGCDRSLIITTKPASYIRKPAKKVIVNLMKAVYPQCENISKDYSIRHINYNNQISLIKQLNDDKKAVYMYPSKDSNVSRLKGSKQELIDLYNLGYSDMEKRKEDIISLLKDD